jgi:hypothetical protein
LCKAASGKKEQGNKSQVDRKFHRSIGLLHKYNKPAFTKYKNSYNLIATYQ